LRGSGGKKPETHFAFHDSWGERRRHALCESFPSATNKRGKKIDNTNILIIPKTLRRTQIGVILLKKEATPRGLPP